MGIRIMGCGTKQFSRTLRKDQFTCPRCVKTDRGATQKFREESFKTWITLAWIPVVPVTSAFEIVTCYGCRGQFPVNVLDSGSTS